MKKLFMILMAFCLAMPAMTTYADSAYTKQLEKARKNEMKKKIKEFNKGGWSLFASSRSMEVALLEHYDKLNQLGENGREVSGVSTPAKSKNAAKQMAMNNALITYAQSAGGNVKGRVMSDMSVTADGDFENFYAAYEREVQKEIQNEMQESMSIIKQTPDGKYEVQVMYILDESAASKARIRAMQNAVKESEVAQRYADKISEFVNEPFETE